MKKLISIIIASILVCLLAVSLVGCGHEHALAKVSAKEKTCYENGNTEYYACSCGEYFLDESATTKIEKDSWVILAKHEPIKVEAKEPSCVVGNTEYYACPCGKFYSDENAQNEIANKSWEIPATGEHEYNKERYRQEENKIYKITSCQCGAEQKQEISGYTLVNPNNASDVINSAKEGVFVLGEGDYGVTVSIGFEEGVFGDITLIGTEGVLIRRITLEKSIFSNVTIKGFSFEGISNGDDGVRVKAEMDKLTVESCEFLVESCIRGDEGTIASLFVKNSYFHQADYYMQGQFSPIYFTKLAEEVEIVGNIFINCRYNAIQLGGVMNATVLIEDNVIDGTRSRAFRFVSVMSKMIIRNNTISNVKDLDMAYIDEVGSFGSITFSGNTYNGKAWNPENVPAEMSGVFIARDIDSEEN